MLGYFILFIKPEQLLLFILTFASRASATFIIPSALAFALATMASASPSNR